MYRWYKKSSVCYVYLSDVGSSRKDLGLYDDLALRTRSQPPPRWYTRGWTLQELIAPADVDFYSSDWTFLGTKLGHMRTLSEFTGIDFYALGGGDLRKLTVARRMSWVSKRKTTVVEDIAYCLLGIFDINMPLLYGEGEKAFIRLQEEIMKISDDQSIFAWRDDESLDTYREEYGNSFHQTGLLAAQPAFFKTSGSVGQFQPERPGRSTSGATNQGIKVEFLMCREACYQSGQVYLAVLDSQLGSIPGVLAGIRMRQLSPGSQGFACIDTHQLIQFARYDMQNQIDLKGFDPTEKQDKLVDLKLRKFLSLYSYSQLSYDYFWRQARSIQLGRQVPSMYDKILSFLFRRHFGWYQGTLCLTDWQLRRYIRDICGTWEPGLCSLSILDSKHSILGQFICNLDDMTVFY
jgi:hypothetical protein